MNNSQYPVRREINFSLECTEDISTFTDTLTGIMNKANFKVHHVMYSKNVFEYMKDFIKNNNHYIYHELFTFDNMDHGTVVLIPDLDKPQIESIKRLYEFEIESSNRIDT